MKPALVILSDRDTDAPDLPGIATVSKAASWDGGGWVNGLERAATGGVLWVDRPYFTGVPSLEWLDMKARITAQVGGLTQVGNEQNLPLEGWIGGPVAWLAFWRKLNTDYTADYYLAMPPSPAVPGWTDWVDRQAPRLAVHAYGGFDEMKAVVQWYLANTSGDLYITECNPGAGNFFDLNAWAHEHLRPFLDWCASVGRVRMVAYFAFRWDQSSKLPSSVDAAGTDVVKVLQEFKMPAVDYPNAVWVGSQNKWNGRQGHQVVAVINHIAEGSCSQTRNWFQNPNGTSSHYLVCKDGRVEQYVKESDGAYTNGIEWDKGYSAYKSDLSIPWIKKCWDQRINPNFVTVTIEHEGYTGQMMPEPMVRASIDLNKYLVDKYKIPHDRQHITGHFSLDAVNRGFCPGSAFPWSKLMAELGSSPVPDVPRFKVGPGFLEWLRKNHDAGEPRQDEWPDSFGNAFLWLTASPKYPKGALLIWRAWLNEIRVVSWD